MVRGKVGVSGSCLDGVLPLTGMDPNGRQKDKPRDKPRDKREASQRAHAEPDLALATATPRAGSDATAAAVSRSVGSV